jgi:hypothetical protein
MVSALDWYSVAMENDMSHDSRRMTLVSRHTQLQQRKWLCTPEAPCRIVLLDSFTALRHTVESLVVAMDADVERIILDRSGSASDYLALLAELPHEITGDVLMIRDDETGFLSAMGRGGDRILYALSANDLRFYLETHTLVSAGDVLAAPAERDRQVVPFRPRMAVA